MIELDVGIPDHLVEISREIEADVSGRIGDDRDDRRQRRAGLFGQYMAAAAELLSEEVGVVQASAIVHRYADRMLEERARRIDAARALPAEAAR